MSDPVSTLLLLAERELASLPTAALAPAKAGSRIAERIAEICARPASPGMQAFFVRYDGGTLAPRTRLFTFEESHRLKRDVRRATDLKGLWPLLERDGRLFALDAEFAGTDGEWPVVELADRSVDRAGSSLLRFLQALAAELALPDDVDDLVRARALCRRDPGLAEHWVNLVDGLEAAGQFEEADQALFDGLRVADPLGPALVMAAGLRCFDRGDQKAFEAALRDAAELEPLTARDDDARLDAAAVAYVLAVDRKDDAAANRAREQLGSAAPSTAAYWRGEALAALVSGRQERAALAARVVTAFLPDDRDVAKLIALGGKGVEGLRAILKGRDALDRLDLDEGLRAAKIAVAELPDIGLSHALLAEVLNARHDRGGFEAARKASELNPALMEAWRELGDAYLEQRQAAKAEESYREFVRRDPASGVGLAKLAQAQLEQGRTREALENIEAAAERGGDVFFVNAVRGDVLSEMNRHADAAEAYDQALTIEPEDHWALHQAALEHGKAGHDDRALELFERAVASDYEGCHQTLVDYADLMRRLGRIGDAVRLYRRAVAAVPGDLEWRQVLREAERELQSAPN
ncbi:MAG TPA: tetratricopeptide repeat protein [Polyangia bacterium]